MEQDLETRALEAAKGMYWASYDEYGHDRAFVDGISAYQSVMREGRTRLDHLLDRLWHSMDGNQIREARAAIHAHFSAIQTERDAAMAYVKRMFPDNVWDAGSAGPTIKEARNGK